ncbi:hypothetical protein DR66_5432 [Delftia acidovorans]|nr:hypothetical protein DR66_5432 [Delftia acidovorans]
MRVSLPGGGALLQCALVSTFPISRNCGGHSLPGRRAKVAQIQCPRKALFLLRRAACLLAWMVVGSLFWMTAMLPAQAGMRISGSISSNASWPAASSPVLLQGDVVLESGATLTLEPGLVIQMEPGASFTVRDGAVRAMGTAQQPITITSSRPQPAPGDWGEWRFLAGTRSGATQWAHVRIEYGSGLVVEGASPGLDQVSILHHKGPALRVDLQSSPRGSGLRAEGNGLDAVLVPAGVITTSVQWALTGIPYLVEGGLIEVGRAPFSIEPAEITVGRNRTGTMTLHLGVPAPAGGRTVSLATGATHIASVGSSLHLEEGRTQADFNVTGSAYNLGTTRVTARHPDLGEAVASITVADLPRVGLQVPHSAMLIGHPHRASVQLSHPAPAEGVEVQLTSTPEGRVVHPASVKVAAGETSREIQIQGTAAAVGESAQLFVKARNYLSEEPVWLTFTDKVRVGLDYAPSILVVGEEETFIIAPVLPPPPAGGLKARLSSSNPAVLAVAPAETQLAEGQMYQYDAPVTVKGVGPGRASVLVHGDFAEGESREIEVWMPTVLSLAATADSGKVVVGQGLTAPQAVRVSWRKDADSLHQYSGVSVDLRCENPEICQTVRSSVQMSEWSTSEYVEIIGLAPGTTRLIAGGRQLTTATIPVEVVGPQSVALIVQDEMSTRRSAEISSASSALTPQRYMSLRQGFHACLSVPEAAPYDRQRPVAPDMRVDVGLYDRSPADVVQHIRDLRQDGDVVDKAFIQTWSGCTPALFVEEATQPGSYRIGADLPGGQGARSETIRVLPDRGLTVNRPCGDCSDMAVARGFASDVVLRPTYLGSEELPEQPMQARLRCVDAAICSAQEQVEIAPDGNSGTARVLGLALGATDLEVSAPSMPDLYPEPGRERIEVVEPRLSFDRWKWDDPDRANVQMTVGDQQSYAICLGDTSWAMLSYPLADLQASVVSSQPSVLGVGSASVAWPAGQPCMDLAVKALAVGSADITVVLPGVAPHTKRWSAVP